MYASLFKLSSKNRLLDTARSCPQENNAASHPRAYFSSEISTHGVSLPELGKGSKKKKNIEICQ